MANPGNSASEQISDELVDIVHQREAAPAIGAVAALEAAVELLEETPAEEREELVEKMRGKLGPIIGEQPEESKPSLSIRGLMTAAEEQVVASFVKRMTDKGIEVDADRARRIIRTRRRI